MENRRISCPDSNSIDHHNPKDIKKRKTKNSKSIKQHFVATKMKWSRKGEYHRRWQHLVKIVIGFKDREWRKTGSFPSGLETKKFDRVDYSVHHWVYCHPISVLSFPNRTACQRFTEGIRPNPPYSSDLVLKDQLFPRKPKNMELSRKLKEKSDRNVEKDRTR